MIYEESSDGLGIHDFNIAFEVKQNTGTILALLCGFNMFCAFYLGCFSESAVYSIKGL